MTSFSIDLGDDTVTALREIAELTAESPDILVRRAIEESVADYIDGRVAMQRLADPSDAVISSEKMWRGLEEEDIVALAVASLAEVPAEDLDLLTQKIREQ